MQLGEQEKRLTLQLAGLNCSANQFLTPETEAVNEETCGSHADQNTRSRLCWALLQKVLITI